MTLLVIGLALFVLLHLFPCVRPLRAQIVERLGEMPYKAAFSVLSLIALVLVVRGYSSAPFVELWQPPSWGRHVTVILMLPAFILLAAAYLPGNLKRRVAHPMLYAVIVWSLAHLLANGDLASVVLFATFGLYAIADLVSVLLRDEVMPKRVSWIFDLMAIVVGAIVYALVVQFHMSLFGVPVLVAG